MNSNPLQEMGNRLGFMAYMFVMSGGRPDWSGLFGQGGLDAIDTAAARIELGDVDPILNTVPLDVARERERATTNGY